VHFQGLSPPFDKKGFRAHNIVIIGPARQPDCPSGLQVAWPKFGMSQPFGVLYRACSVFPADRPKKFGLLNSWASFIIMVKFFMLFFMTLKEMPQLEAVF
jgi:hypothetical protein